MLNSSILVYGFNGVGTEVVKTLVLAGVGNVTVLDHRTVNERDFGCNFFLREQEGDLGKLVSCGFIIGRESLHCVLTPDFWIYFGTLSASKLGHRELNYSTREST